MRELNRWADYVSSSLDSFFLSGFSTPPLASAEQQGTQFDFLTKIHPDSDILLFFSGMQLTAKKHHLYLISQV